MTDAANAPVLIVGAGGAGLSLALLLEQHGVSSILVERRGDVSWFPRARNLNFRTLEIFRGLGLEKEVLAAGTQVSRTLRKDSLAASGHQDFPSIEDALRITDHPEALSPEPMFWYCPQSVTEPLLGAAARERGCDIRYGFELESFTQDSAGVTATVSDRATGARTVLRADYLVAADGAHSHVREQLGVPMVGEGVLEEYYIFVYFRAPWADLVRGYESDAVFIDRPGVRGFFLITDPDRGMFLIQQNFEQEYTPERCRELILDGIGVPDIPVEVVEIAHWRPAQQVAERFRVGRVFLAGDAAHTMPPKLGMGVNTAIAGMHNLAWKLAAVLHGQAGEALLDTYEAERHPIAGLISRQSLVGPAATLITGGEDDALLPAEERVSMFSLTIGNRYRSRAVLSEHPAPEGLELLNGPEDLSGTPGTRIPHGGLARNGESISPLDLFDGRFVLLTGPQGAPWTTAASEAAAATGVRMAAYRLGPDADLRDPDGKWWAATGLPADGVLLARPDGIVAWRTDALPADPTSALTATLTAILARDT
ncbi:FAD-dependent monooxygenase [Nocardia sp. NPDC101769]|uniref:FAD-dependent monooxygenase n=1 Tax=Nocardia sp. NPDC101769 TaxID=3364333 RepID=UPI0037FF3051